jgi:Ca2+-binding EF-hand superfamily protein
MRFGAARFSLLNIPEPVSSADADLDRSVLASEFDAAAVRRFDMLDSNADGSIDRKELPDYASASGGHRRR